MVSAWNTISWYIRVLSHHLYSSASTIATSDRKKIKQNKGCPLVLTFEAGTGIWMITLLIPVINVLWLRLPTVYLCFPLGPQFWSHRLFSFWAFLRVAALEALKRGWHCIVILGYRLFDSRVPHWRSLTFDCVWTQGWLCEKHLCIFLMTEVAYPILYDFNLILGVSSHLAPDAIYKSSEPSKILPKIYCFIIVPRIKGGQLEAVRAGGYGSVKNALCIADDKW